MSEEQTNNRDTYCNAPRGVVKLRPACLSSGELSEEHHHQHALQPDAGLAQALWGAHTEADPDHDRQQWLF